ncbi:trypsin-like peptidase domain-containing protein [soil metagenome]
MKFKQILATVLISTLTALGVIFTSNKISNHNPNFQEGFNLPSNYKYAKYGEQPPAAGPVDFTQAATIGIPTVVHIKTKTNPRQVNNNLPRQRNPFSDLFGDDDLFNQFFGNGGQQRNLPQMASGSGVIISEDGYIVTNNHVVAGADEVNVTLANRKTYTAKVIGADPAFDLAVIKVPANALPFMLYGNSSEVKIGQWVLAIGYPLNLDATVTAGIISAKARSLGLNRDRTGNTNTAVESFIQTDAAVNQGNSGGALMNTEGQLIGINSAIASPTGFYSGYSYAIPVNIVKKVVNDIIKFGNVQRGFLGAMYRDAGLMTDEQKTAENIPVSADGIYILETTKTGAAAAAGLKKGDQIRKVQNVDITSGAELQEQLSQFRPGDKVSITYDRNGTLNTVQVTLKNSVGNYEVVRADAIMDNLGADLANLEPAKAREYGLPGGVVVKKINDGVINNQTRMRDGFIITKVDGKVIKNVDDMRTTIGDKNRITVQGYYPGYEEPFEYPLILQQQ